jgi:hypothetical protein
MSDIAAFVDCQGQKAMHRVNAERYVSGAPAGSECFARLEGDLLLCDSCTKFWIGRQGARDLATLERAVGLRMTRIRQSTKRY